MLDCKPCAFKTKFFALQSKFLLKLICSNQPILVIVKVLRSSSDIRLVARRFGLSQSKALLDDTALGCIGLAVQLHHALGKVATRSTHRAKERRTRLRRCLRHTETSLSQCKHTVTSALLLSRSLVLVQELTIRISCFTQRPACLTERSQIILKRHFLFYRGFSRYARRSRDTGVDATTRSSVSARSSRGRFSTRYRAASTRRHSKNIRRSALFSRLLRRPVIARQFKFRFDRGSRRQKVWLCFNFRTWRRLKTLKFSLGFQPLRVSHRHSSGCHHTTQRSARPLLDVVVSTEGFFQPCNF